MEDTWLLDRKPVDVSVDGETYWSIRDFAMATRRTKISLYKLISDGNQYGKLAVKVVERMYLIPVKQLEEFTFVDSGRYGKMRSYAYCYNRKLNTMSKKYTFRPVKRSGRTKVEA